MQRTVVAMTIWIAAVAGARGQVGGSAAGCAQRWGDPVGGTIDPDGYGALRFSNGGFEMEADFVAHVAQRLVFRSPDFDGKAVSRVLDANRGDAEWNAFQQPGSAGRQGGQRAWMRSDEQAMAEFADGRLTITGPGWYPHLANPPRPAPAAGAPANGPPPAAQPPPPEPLAGFWRSATGRQPVLAIHVLGEGALSWMRYGETGPRELPMRWKRDRNAQEAVCTVAPDRGTTPADQTPQIAGRIVLAAPNELRWRREPDPRHEAFLAQWGMESDIAFQRTDALPRWKPSTPATLPDTGATREDAVRLLGKPDGTMAAGGREILVYPWGNVFLTNGKVRGVE